MKGFLRGVSSVLEFFPSRRPSKLKLKRKTDAENIESDWKKILDWEKYEV